MALTILKTTELTLISGGIWIGGCIRDLEDTQNPEPINSTPEVTLLSEVCPKNWGTPNDCMP